EPVKEYEDKVKRTLQQVLKQYDQHIGEVNSIIQSGLQFWAAGERRKTQQLQRELRERYNMDIQYWNDRLDLQRQQLDRELQHRLYMMGFVDAATEEQHQRELELAIESGDQQRIFLAHSNFEKFKIEEEFAQKKANMELEMATEKEAMDLAFRQKEAELNYRAAMAEWKSALIMGAVNTALGITKAFPNKFLMGLIAGAGKTQMLVMSQNKPIQTFSNGGIVGGNSFRGDNILTRQNSGEIDINKRQQKKLWDFIEGGSEGNAQRPLHLTINLNSRVLTKEVVADINDRHELIFDTSVVRR
ncbi:MAG: hypothetical protein FWE02_03900, partial [Defluviitaleaceae bacterium]|nr:hypothetical protein [Defluviitaleaceae bacterium]